MDPPPIQPPVPQNSNLMDPQPQLLTSPLEEMPPLLFPTPSIHMGDDGATEIAGP